MRVGGYPAPAGPFSVEDLPSRNGYKRVRFFENVLEDTGSEDPRYVWDEYTLDLLNRAGLEQDIADNLETWKQLAVSTELSLLASEVRKKRDELLSATDYIMRDDYPAATEYKQQIAEYSNALRDIPEQSGFPYYIEWPEKPVAPQKVARALTLARVDNLEQSIDALVGGENL